MTGMTGMTTFLNFLYSILKFQFFFYFFFQSHIYEFISNPVVVIPVIRKFRPDMRIERIILFKKYIFPI